MLFELVAVIVAGIAAGGVVSLLRRFIPAITRWLIPVAAGAAMIAASVSLEYTWFGRVAATLPEGVEVAITHEERALWRPWTYAFPYVDRFLAVDRERLLTNDAAAGQLMANIYVFGRWSPTRRVQAVFDCDAGRRADLLPGTALAADGSVPEGAWIDTGREDAVMRIVCDAA